jgi:segregation and condensation protein A
MVYKVTLENFEGPMDLLLHLIQKNDLDIHDVQISAITNEYLEYIKVMEMLNIEVAGDFMVMASTLMYIKSKKLLPHHEHEEEETAEQMEDDLRARLIEYKRYKEASKIFQEREVSQMDYHYRENFAFNQDEIECDMEATIFDIVSAFKTALSKIKPEAKEILGELITVEQKMQEILYKLEDSEYINITELFSVITKLELIVTFLATLELIRLNKISVRQNQSFGDIRVYKRVETAVAEEVSIENNLEKK